MARNGREKDLMVARWFISLRNPSVWPWSRFVCPSIANDTIPVGNGQAEGVGVCRKEKLGAGGLRIFSNVEGRGAASRKSLGAERLGSDTDGPRLGGDQAHSGL